MAKSWKTIGDTIAETVTDRQQAATRRLEETRSLLREMSDRMSSLSDTLQLGGDPLTEDQQMLVKMAHMPLINGLMQEIKFAYVAGNDATGAIERLAELLQPWDTSTK